MDESIQKQIEEALQNSVEGCWVLWEPPAPGREEWCHWCIRERYKSPEAVWGGHEIFRFRLYQTGLRLIESRPVEGDAK